MTLLQFFHSSAAIEFLSPSPDDDDVFLISIAPLQVR